MVAHTVMLLTVRVRAFTSSITCAMHNVGFFLSVWQAGVSSRQGIQGQRWLSQLTLPEGILGGEFRAQVWTFRRHAGAEKVGPKGMKR